MNTSSAKQFPSFKLALCGPLLVMAGWLLDYLVIGRFWATGLIIATPRAPTPLNPTPRQAIPVETVTFLANYDWLRMTLPFAAGVVATWFLCRTLVATGNEKTPENQKRVNVAFLAFFAPLVLTGVCESQARMIDDGFNFFASLAARWFPYIARSGAEAELRRAMGLKYGDWNHLPFMAFFWGAVLAIALFAIAQAISKLRGRFARPANFNV